MTKIEEYLTMLLGDDSEAHTIWLNTPNSELDNLTPQWCIDNDEADVVEGLLLDAVTGQPS